MNLIQRSRTKVSAFLKSYGSLRIKKLLWDREFSGTKWEFTDNTNGDCVYQHLEEYAGGGDILDLGCGAGNTATELSADSYRTYVGVDISEIALRKAIRRSEQAGRAAKNEFVQADFLRYTPDRMFNVILFRESMYHVPPGRVKDVLDWYSRFLDERGVFIVRLIVNEVDGLRRRPKAMLDAIESNFAVLAKRESAPGPTVVVFRPMSSAASA